jgi:hypothetical protein
MKIFKKNKNKVVTLEYFFNYVAIFYIITFIFAATLVIFSIFTLFPFYIIGVIFLFGIIFILYKFKVVIKLFDVFIFSIITFFAIFSFFFFHHTLYGVRDEGVYANSAIGITTKGSIYIKDYINFPGWKEHNNLFYPQFLFGTISWIALNYALFNLNGIYASNIIPILIGGFSLYFIAKPMLKKNTIFFLLCFFLSYPMLWFTRRTVSEIIFISLLWYSFYLIRKIYITKNLKLLVPLSLVCSSYLLVRGEGMLYLLLTFLLILFLNRKQKLTVLKYSCVSLLLLFPFLYYSIFISNEYLVILQTLSEKTISKILPNFHFNSQVINTANQQILHIPGSLYYNIFPYTLNIFSKYNLLFFVFSIFLCLIYFLQHHQKNKNIIFLIFLILLNLPTFYSFFDFTIAPDQPWFLRRYLFSIIPLAYFCGFILIVKFVSNIKLRITIMSLLIIINIYISYPILFFKEYPEMPSNIDNIAKLFTSKDYILIDQYSNGWYRIGTELYFRKNLNTNYISYYNNDNQKIFSLLSKINLDNYSNIYIITKSDSELSTILKEPLFHKISSYKIIYTGIIPTTDLLHSENIPNQHLLNLDYDEVKSMIAVPSQKYVSTNELSIYKVESKNNFKKIKI